MQAEMGTRVLGLGIESDSSPDLVGLGLESHTVGLGLDSRPGGLGLRDSDRIRQVSITKSSLTSDLINKNFQPCDSLG